MSRPDDIDSRLARLERRSKAGWLVAGLVLLVGWAPLLGAALVLKDGLKVVGNSAMNATSDPVLKATGVGTHGYIVANTDSPTTVESGFRIQSNGVDKWWIYRPANSTNLGFYDGATRFTIDNTTTMGNGVDKGIITVDPSSSFSVGGCVPFSKGDLQVCRTSSQATGVVYFGNTGGKYLYFDGTNFNFNGAKVVSGGNNTATCSQGGATCTPNLGTCCTVTVPSGTSSCWCGNQSAFNPGTCLVSGTTASCYSSAAGGNTIRVGWF